jgi:malate dehydrogenase (oxaloacetate-decarboxylating)
MRKYSHDTIVRVRLRHRPGQFAYLASAIADAHSLVGEISTVSIGENDTIRDVTIETDDEAHTARVLDVIRALPEIELISTTDRVFEAHRGGKLGLTSSRSKLENGRRPALHLHPRRRARVAGHRARPRPGLGLHRLATSVGIFTNGTRVLGLGDIGPLASLPVMEGKAALYDRFAGHLRHARSSSTPSTPRSSSTPWCASRTGFGGIHLEDIRMPDCFRIEDELVPGSRSP